jgi:hypothetical protein
VSWWAALIGQSAAEVGDTSTPEAIQAAREDLADVAQQRAEDHEASSYQKWLVEAFEKGRFDERTDPVSLAELGEADRRDPLSLDGAFDLISELETTAARLVKHIAAREEAGTEPDDPANQELLDSLKDTRAHLRSLYSRAGLGPKQARARERVLLYGPLRIRDL